MIAQLINGELGDDASHPLSSNIAAIITAFVGMFVIQHNLGYVTGANCGYLVEGAQYIPKMGFISYQRQRVLSYENGYIPVAPDLAVEVLSPANIDVDMDVKIANYLAAGTVVWRVKPLDQQIAVFVANSPVIILGITDILVGGSILPGFALPLRDIFRTPSTA